MKNIHILPTDKPSRLHYFSANKAGYYLCPNNEIAVPKNPNCINHNTYITNDEEIKEGDWYLDTFNNQRIKANQFSDHKHYGNACKKIILTTDQDLIKDGVQSIDNDFLEWFVKNPSCEYVETYSLKEGNEELGYHHYKYEIVIPKEEFNYNMKQETLEEATERAVKSGLFKDKTLFIAGAKWQQERSYSDMQEYATFCIECDRKEMPLLLVRDWYEHYK